MALLKEINKKIGTQIQTGGFHRMGDLLLLCIIVVLTMEMVYNTGSVHGRLTNARFYEWMAYFIVFTCTVYTNARLLVPRFLLRNKLSGYFASIGLCVFLLMLFIILVQNTLYDVPKSYRLTSLCFNIAGNMLLLGLTIASTSVVPLFRCWAENSRRVSELEKTTAEAELQQLKSQINPHFLFNTLNNANIKAEQEPQLAYAILSRLENLLGYQLSESSQEKVLIRNEISFLHDYLELESTRRGNLYYEIKTEGVVEDISIYPLLFIPFVENAVKHSVEVKGKTNIHITFAASGNQLHFQCENTKAASRTSNHYGGLGLKNIKRRLELLFGKSYTLSITEEENKYTVCLCVNL